MRPIPLKMRQEMDEDPFMKTCAIAAIGGCEGKVEWHHTFLWGGKQISEPWAIVPACKKHHDMVNGDRMIRELFKHISLKRATDEDLKKYPKVDWKQVKIYLKVI
jgi:hypothetical protein